MAEFQSYFKAASGQIDPELLGFPRKKTDCARVSKVSVCVCWFRLPTHPSCSRRDRRGRFSAIAAGVAIAKRTWLAVRVSKIKVYYKVSLQRGEFRWENILLKYCETTLFPQLGNHCIIIDINVREKNQKERQKSKCLHKCKWLWRVVLWDVARDQWPVCVVLFLNNCWSWFFVMC